MTTLSYRVPHLEYPGSGCNCLGPSCFNRECKYKGDAFGEIVADRRVRESFRSTALFSQENNTSSSYTYLEATKRKIKEECSKLSSFFADQINQIEIKLIQQLEDYVEERKRKIDEKFGSIPTSQIPLTNDKVMRTKSLNKPLALSSPKEYSGGFQRSRTDCTWFNTPKIEFLESPTGDDNNCLQKSDFDQSDLDEAAKPFDLLNEEINKIEKTFEEIKRSCYIDSKGSFPAFNITVNKATPENFPSYYKRSQRWSWDSEHVGGLIQLQNNNLKVMKDIREKGDGAQNTLSESTVFGNRVMSEGCHRWQLMVPTGINQEIKFGVTEAINVNNREAWGQCKGFTVLGKPDALYGITHNSNIGKTIYECCLDLDKDTFVVLRQGKKIVEQKGGLRRKSFKPLLCLHPGSYYEVELNVL